MQTGNIVLSLTILFIFAAFNLIYSQIELRGNNYLEYSIDEEADEKFFEDWTDVYLNYKNWRVGARYEFHLPPQSYALDTLGQGISQRFVQYQTGNLDIVLGNYYSLFGRGLVFRSFENRMLRWDTNMDGVKFDYYHKYLDFTLLGGRPRDRSGKRHEVLQGGMVTLKPFYLINFGGSYITTKLRSKDEVSWGSVFGDLNFNWGSFYVEKALKDYPARFPEADAWYVTGNLFLGPVTALVEYRDYENFDITEGLTYNNPPAVVREHLYTLMNRHRHVQNANDEKGYMVELAYSLGDFGVLTLNHSKTDDHDDVELYREYYGQFEWDPLYELNLVGGAGEQKDLEARHLNLVGTAKYGFWDYNAVKVIYEHQQVKINLTERQFYNQALTLSYERSPVFSLSFLGERSTDQLSKHEVWLGGQLDTNFLENFDLTVFAGRRRKGKICVGGVCIFRPEFEGVEFRLVNRF